jgi:DNA-binding MarR family transcriptional regulator
MRSKKSKVVKRRPTDAEYQLLASFRYTIRRYLAAVGQNAERVGLTAQQHQALLSIRGGYPGRQTISISELAHHLLIKNHSALELAERLKAAALVEFISCSEDGRKVMLSITPRGEATMCELATGSLRELVVVSDELSRLVAFVGETKPRKRQLNGRPVRDY